MRTYNTPGSSSSYTIQYYTEAIDKTNQTWQRVKDETWSPWVRVDNFGCATSADLASLLGAISPFLTLKRYTQQVAAGGTYSIPGWSPSSLVLMTTQTHGGDTNHLYFYNTSLHAGSGLKITFSDGVITSTDNVAQSIRITMLLA